MKRSRASRPRLILNRSAVSELLNLLAWPAGRSPGYLSPLMAGKRSPSPDARRLLQQALETNDFDLLFIIAVGGRSKAASGRCVPRHKVQLKCAGRMNGKSYNDFTNGRWTPAA